VLCHELLLPVAAETLAPVERYRMTTGLASKWRRIGWPESLTA
jgi:hypothetical protein